jgi:hypothetical protein
MNSADILLYQSEPNPNDIRLRVPEQVSIPATAQGQIICARMRLIPGTATGGEVKTKPKSTGGSVTMVTPTFPMRPPVPKKKKPQEGHARGQVLGVRITLIPGYAFVGPEDWPPPPAEPDLRDLTDEEIQEDNAVILAYAALRAATSRKSVKVVFEIG